MGIQIPDVQNLGISEYSGDLNTQQQARRLHNLYLQVNSVLLFTCTSTGAHSFKGIKTILRTQDQIGTVKPIYLNLLQYVKNESM